MGVDDVGIDDDTEGGGRRVVRAVLLDVGEGFHDGSSQPLVQLSGGEVVGHVEIEGAAHDTLGDGEVQKAVELRSDAVVDGEGLQNTPPDGDIWNLLLRHVAPGKVDVPRPRDDTAQPVDN